ncbi:L-aspartate oxidase [Rubrobacter marinus]|uniref:L-aspartate oxidase n=1 Tax=Rubrobacter marinus TaxID=2653852 RepID=A0A6G8Q216_9ACTN|nr:L-aspartate oxidase [Rubrobacter marinus]QIN80498.1 L-aspartate oxidase [Rubrobacter marinus]
MLGPADVIVVGGGIAGGVAALAAASKGARVTLLTGAPDPEETNTRYAQGGIIHTGPDDSPELLVRDVLAAGGGDPAAARLLAAEGPALVRRLLIEALGVPFDREAGGFEGLHLTREGAHSVPRIVHHRDSTGREVQRALTRALRAEERVEILPATVALELIVSRGRCVGVHASHDGEAVTLLARGVVLATGGLAALYEHTTNPPYATGGGYALALRAGAALRDLHYVQFHPTALYAPGTAGDRSLVSEAVRGEGGVLRDPDGEEFVDHPLGSLAPRDVVARSIRAMMDRTGSPCAYLDVSHLRGDYVRERFPDIHARCLRSGIDMAREPIPVVPAAHYSCGGVATDLLGRTSLRGLWAAGEVASTGLHGSNRLASTSLLEGLVFGRRAGEDAARPSGVPDAAEPAPLPLPTRAPEGAWTALRRTMWEHAGLVRDACGLRRGLAEVGELEGEYGGTSLAGPLAVARAVLEGALAERESRGCHYRSDAPCGEGALAEEARLSGV